MNTQTLDLLSFFNESNKQLVVPVGTTVTYDSSKGPCIIRGRLENHGTISITGSKNSKQVIVAAEIINDGSLSCEVDSLVLNSASVTNTGLIKAERDISFNSTTGKLEISGAGGKVSATDEILFNGATRIAIKDGDYAASRLRFVAEIGTVLVQAEKLSGEISVDAKSSKVGTNKKNAAVALLSGSHVYYNIGGNVSLGAVSHPGETVVILASGEVSTGAITAGDLFIGSGVDFTIDGTYPDPTSDNDADVSWDVATTYGYQPLVVDGAITVSGNATIKAFTVEAADITVGGNLEIITLNEYGEITITGDIDVDGTASLLAYQIDFEGEDFNVAGDLVMGASTPASYYSYINLTGSFTASANVTLNCNLTEFIGDDFTMDGDDKELSTEGALRIETTDFINIKADVTANQARNLLFYSDGDVATGSITVDNSEATSAGAIIIKANRTGGSSEFVIGDTGKTNGVNGTLKTDTVNGGATENTSYSHGAVYVTNGGDGGITVTNASDISVKGTDSKSGGITLNANDGTIKLPTGTLSAEGTGDNSGSFIQLLADTIETVDGTIISVSDNGVAEKQKLLQIVAETIVVAGTNGLKIKADGNGNTSYPNILQIFPKGSVTLYDNDFTQSFTYWYQNESLSYTGAAAINFDGSSTAPLEITCNGSHSRLTISAYLIVFDTGDTKIECKGDEDHEIQIARSSTGGDGLQFNGGDVTIDASGLDDGDGGSIAIYMDPIYRSDTGKATMKADGKESGDGGHILLSPGTTDLILGTDDEQFSFSAKGGSSSGSGGKVELQGYSSSIEVNGATDSATVLDVSVPGTDGDGGEINIVAYGAAGLTFDTANPSYLKANGGSSSGDGGKIIIVASNAPITIGSGNGDVSLSAVAEDGDSAGGTVDITAWSGITAESISIDVSAHGTGDGGTVKLNAVYSTLTLNGGALHADGGDDGGNGGTVHLEGGQITLPAEENTLLSADGKSGGNGGTVEIVTQWASVDIGSDDNQILVSASGSESSALKHRASFVNGFGDGGHVYTWQAKSYTVAAGTSLKVTAYDNGKGGKIEINCTEFVTVNGEMNADGLGEGEGGTISIEVPLLNLGVGAKFSANGGLGVGGKGGKIEIKNAAASVPLALSGTAPIFEAKGAGTKEGGSVTIDKAANFDIHKLIKVDGGESVSPGNKFGSIKLNGVTAQQWRTSNGSNWPQTYWKSFDTANADDVIATNATGLTNTVKGLLDQRIIGGTSQHSAQIYYMEKDADFDTFFGVSDASGSELGLTIAAIGVTAIFQKVGTVAVETSTGVSTIKQNATAHELGHQMDYLLVGLSGIPNTDPLSFAHYLEADYVTFDSVSCSVVLPTYPCTTFTGTNSAKLEEWLATGKSAAKKRQEMFAHAFAHEMYPNTSYPALNTVFTSFTNTTTYMHGLFS